MRSLVLGLMAATALSSAAFAQAAPVAASSPFGAPSTALTSEERTAISEEAAKIKREREEAAARAGLR